MLSEAWAGLESVAGGVCVWGTMGQGTQFTLQLVRTGGVPGLVTGATIYQHKNGSQSRIDVYGTVAYVNPGTCHLSLVEQVNGKVCGHFDFDIPEHCLTQSAEGGAVGRWWLGQKELAFVDVKARVTAYDGKPNAIADMRDMSGKYGYCIASDQDKSVLRQTVLSVAVGPDKLQYAFHQDIGEETFSVQFESKKGYGSDPSDAEDCWSFRLGDIDYDVVTDGQTICILRSNASQRGSNGLPKGVSIEGVYPRLTYSVSAHQERQEGEAVIYFSQSIDVPFLPEPQAGYIRDWVKENSSTDLDLPYWALAEAIATNGLSQIDTWEDMEPWQAPWSDDVLSCDIFNTHSTYLNLCRSGCQYYGGAHGFPYCWSMTMDRKTGHIMKWTDWFTNPQAIEPLVAKAMLEQNSEVNFDNTPLPFQDPWFYNGEMNFMYQPYEAAPYSEGMPSCSIPIKELLPYMTAYGKRVAK